MSLDRHGLRVGAVVQFFACGLSALGAIQPAAADTQLGTVSVTATRSETAVDEVPATITTLDRETLERRQPADEAALFGDEPDVSLARDLRRFGATRPNIRGIEDNRVVQMVDGVRMADFRDGGGPTNFTLSAPLGVPTDFLKRVEILRGPASSLYGSDAIGGVVGYLTLDPADLIRDGNALGARYRLGYHGANDGVTNALLGAWRGEGAEVLLGYAHTAFHEFDNRGDQGGVSAQRSRPNPQDGTDRGALAKLVLRPAAGHKLSFTVDGREQEVDVTVKRLAASLPKVTAMDGDDESRRLRASLEWEHRPAQAFYDRLTLRLHHQEDDTENANRQARSDTGASCSATRGSGNDCLVDQEFSMSQRALGGSVQFESGTAALGAEHLLTYGVDLWRKKVSEKRDADVLNLTTGTVSKSLAGDSFPLRDFPDGRTDAIGVFVQDEITRGSVTVTPGLRFDWRKLTPEVDALARQVLQANGREAVESSESALSPKIAALWRVDPAWSLYGQLVTGFRAPNYEEVNGSFRNSVQRYGISPNPDLEPETSVGAELGVKLHRPTLRAQFAVYDNHYRDFIETVRLACPADPRCITDLSVTFMAENLARVRIYGAEARMDWNPAPGWTVDSAIAWAHGTDRENHVPLNSIEPARLSLGVTRDAGAWGAAARLRAARGVTRTDDRDGTWFRPGGYGVVGLSAWWRPSAAARLTVAIDNLFDRKYWLWSDIRQADDRDPQGVAFYSQPGRTLAASFSYAF